jgi:uncharacterized protein YllA (UPF0747 family)
VISAKGEPVGLEYDEIKITTRREIAVCEDAIRKLKKTIAVMEQKYHMSTAEFMKNVQAGADRSRKDFVQWYESLEALTRWEERLKGHMKIIE